VAKAGMAVTKNYKSINLIIFFVKHWDLKRCEWL